MMIQHYNRLFRALYLVPLDQHKRLGFFALMRSRPLGYEGLVVTNIQIVNGVHMFIQHEL
jgi:hypothetical protein